MPVQRPASPTGTALNDRVTGTAAPGAEAPGGQAPDGKVPGPEVPDGDAPGTEVPGAEAPGRRAPGTQAPGGRVRKDPAPGLPGRAVAAGPLVRFRPGPPVPSSTGTSAATRMLLAADGSTTVLLEAWLSTRLRTVVDVQQERPLGALPQYVSRALELPPGSMVVERHSRLVTPDGEVVSANRVVLPTTAAELVLPGPGVPLGHHLALRGLSGSRQRLSAGTGVWYQDERPCSRKEYVITCGPGVRIHVHELFNPARVPPPEVRTAAA